MGIIASVLNPHTSEKKKEEQALPVKHDDGLVRCCGVTKKRKVILRWVGVGFILLVLATLPICIWVLRERLQEDLHIIAWFVGGCFALLTLPVSAFGIILHLNHYNKPVIQRYILRIMWMPPIYGLASWFSLLFRHYSVYWTLLREFYEAYCIYCFLFFLMALLEDNAKTLEAEKKDRADRRAAGEIVEEPVPPVEGPKYGRRWLFCGEKVLKPQTYLWVGKHHEMNEQEKEAHKYAVHHMFPLCCLPDWSLEQPSYSSLPDDSHFAANCRYGVLFYVVIKVLTSIATFILVLNGAYGEGEFDPHVGYPYVALIYNGAQLWAMYCLVLFYHTYVKELAPYRPFPKFCAIKAVVFFAFWQSVLIAGAVSNKIIARPAETIYTDQEISAGLQDLIICIEMFIAAWFHLYAFSHQDYKRTDAEKLSMFQMIKTIFDVKDVAVDLKVHAKVHVNVIKKLQEHSRPDREMEMSEQSEDSVASQNTTTVTYVTTETPATTTSTTSSSSTRTSSAAPIQVRLEEDSDLRAASSHTSEHTVTVKEGATVPINVTASGPVASITVEVEKSPTSA